MSYQQMFVSGFLGKTQRKRFGWKIQVFRVSCRKCISASNFTDTTEYMILFYLQKLGAGRHIHIIGNAKNYECDGLGNSIPNKMMFVSASQVKTCERRCIFSGQCAIFQGWKTHRNMAILTMCKISMQTRRIKLLICNILLLH